MKLKFAIALSLPILIGINGCDKTIDVVSKDSVKCGDEDSLQLVKSLLQDSIQSSAKRIANNEGVALDGSALRASTSQVGFNLADVRTSKTDPNSTKIFCVAALSTTLDSETINRANIVSDYYEQSNISEMAFQQDIDMDGNTVSYSIEYSIQPTDDGTSIYGQLQNGSELINFIGTVVVNALQKNAVQAYKAEEQKANAESIVAAKKAAAEEAASIAKAEATASAEATDNIANATAEKARAKATMDYKRSEFNDLWKSASTETRETLAEGQKEWVAERDEICLNRAQEAEVVWQEMVRMDCISELLGERYYAVKEYIDTYD